MKITQPFSLYKENINKLIEISIDAGKAIMDVYKTDFSFEEKDDNSPLTKADILSNEIIINSLKKLTPRIPVLSEESSRISIAERIKWNEYWLVDPLDGTKEFIEKNDEFTTNISLIREGRPEFGLIHAPALFETYWGGEEIGSACFISGENKFNPKQIMVSQSNRSHIRIVSSRSHPSPRLNLILDSLTDYNLVKVGSSLKFCKIANGEADCYPRLGPTSEWDTAAGEAIAKAAGAIVVDLNNNQIQYNKEKGFLNPNFIVASNEKLKRQILSTINRI